MMEKGLSARQRSIIKQHFDPGSPGQLRTSPVAPGTGHQAPAQARDPVCGRLIETSVEAGTRVFVHRERLYYFCGMDCRDRFASMPERFTGGKADGGPGRRSRRRVR